jgi:tetratricopeptide (TPR) repeat protein
MGKRKSILIRMRVKNYGEGRGFFPFLFLVIGVFLICGIAFLRFPVSGGTAERTELSRFDQLAEEATQLNRRNQHDKVIALLEPYKGDKKNDSALFFNELGVAYRNLGKYAEAIEAYRAGLLRDPENPVLMKNLGDAHLMKKEYSLAIEQLQKALRGNPRFHQAHYSLGVAYYRLEKYPEALDEFEIVLKLSPEYASAQKFRTEIQKKLKSPSR